MSSQSIHFGPRLVARPTGHLRAALLVRPRPAIENARPLIGEPGAIYARALEQHDILVKTLQYFGVQTEVIESSSEDGCETAVADAAIAFEDGAMVMRPTPMTRRAEADRIESEFTRIDVPLAGHIAPPGLLDGSDVVLVDGTAFVGVGRRGNAIGRNGFAKVAKAHGYRVVEVALSDEVPSLSAVVGAAAHDMLVIAPDRVDRAAFGGFKLIELDRGEALSAGVLCLGERHVLADIRYRTSLAKMHKAGIAVEAIDLYEFTKLGITPSLLALALKRD
jgi:N-dimethylarginine dimethylaminohydrolase